MDGVGIGPKPYPGDQIAAAVLAMRGALEYEDVWDCFTTRVLKQCEYDALLDLCIAAAVAADHGSVGSARRKAGQSIQLHRRASALLRRFSMFWEMFLDRRREVLPMGANFVDSIGNLLVMLEPERLWALVYERKVWHYGPAGMLVVGDTGAFVSASTLDLAALLFDFGLDTGSAMNEQSAAALGRLRQTTCYVRHLLARVGEEMFEDERVAARVGSAGDLWLLPAAQGTH